MKVLRIFVPSPVSFTRTFLSILSGFVCNNRGTKTKMHAVDRQGLSWSTHKIHFGNMLTTTLLYRFSRNLVVKLFWPLCGAPLGVHIAQGSSKYCSPLCCSTHCIWAMLAGIIYFCSYSFWFIFEISFSHRKSAGVLGEVEPVHLGPRQCCSGRHVPH